MSIRPGVFWEGEKVEISATFVETDGTPMNATGVILRFRRPDKTLDEIPLTATEGKIGLDYLPNMVGTWYFRLTCEAPTPSVMEGKFEVVASTVLLQQ